MAVNLQKIIILAETVDFLLCPAKGPHLFPPSIYSISCLLAWPMK
ncbi:hypothetical protein DAI22_08g150800 [Oryza sativa Japonica Group]|nr:hypothetical protein DAI22_08g150800 [Oryza sativa Japonica Group]